ncbi:DUF2489 domain-containing protein [Biformimicrobium ophioploci]|uniref:DUF2489 domain-containing protein n=1 Tax=Biformimicrobium ophioploci TaxID=3036711 RepID=A0ABQ6M1J0_9GAMM|nr:DUF2489 domain-containing protein [Microbulbifer sp. NKW57]GMG88152.1 hypothetical protein MNKW57_24730 [Microbulbifer sp. NKW57]
MNQIPDSLLIVAAAIIFVLSAVAGYYLWKLHKLRRLQAVKLKAIEEAAEAQRERVNNSIQILAAAILSEEVGLTEGAIRISTLMASLQVTEAEKSEFVAMFTLAEKTGHIPILEEWKKLKTRKKLEYLKEMDALEAEYGDFVRDAAERLRGRVF